MVRVVPDGGVNLGTIAANSSRRLPFTHVAHTTPKDWAAADTTFDLEFTYHDPLGRSHSTKLSMKPREFLGKPQELQGPLERIAASIQQVAHHLQLPRR